MPTIDPSLASAIAAIGSAIAGGLATWAAYRSAAAAKAAVKMAGESERRAILRDLRATALNVATEAAALKTMTSLIAIEHRTLGAFTGSNGGSSEAEMQSKLTDIADACDGFRKSAGRVEQDYLQLRVAPIDDLSDMLARFHANLRSMSVMREQARYVMDDISAKNRMHYEQRLQSALR